MMATIEALDLDTLRLRSEFLEQPCLTMTVAQVARLLSVRIDHARNLLAALERDGFLVRTADGSYRRGRAPLGGLL
jgi:predicted transcriptional regulator of viral defense system